MWLGSGWEGRAGGVQGKGGCPGRGQGGGAQHEGYNNATGRGGAGLVVVVQLEDNAAYAGTGDSAGLFPGRGRWWVCGQRGLQAQGNASVKVEGVGSI